MLLPYITIKFMDGHEENYDHIFEVKKAEDLVTKIGLVNAILKNYSNVECIYYKGIRIWTN